jgi:hypothetical protein
MQFLFNVFIGFCCGFLIGLIYFFSKRIYKIFSQRNNFNYPRELILLGIVPEGIEKRLLLLVGGNRKMALRLVDKVQKKYPDRNIIWCWERAIEELDGDRRSNVDR